MSGIRAEDGGDLGELELSRIGSHGCGGERNN